MKCVLCKKEVYLAYRCSYCGQYFCDDHRLPEQHLCPGLPKRSWSSYKKHQMRPRIYRPVHKTDRRKTWKTSSRKTGSRKGKIIILLIVIGFLCLYVYQKDSLDPDVLLEPITDIIDPKGIEADFTVVPLNPWIGENISVEVDVRNRGKETEILSCCVNDREVEGKIMLESGQSEIVQFSFTGDYVGVYEVSLCWEVGKLNTTVEVTAPDETLSSNPSYYYGWAKRYVSAEYQVPENKDIDGLIFFLDQVELPEYEAGIFDCSECSSLLEWLLEGAGFHAYIALTPSFILSHAWVQVEMEDGIVALEATQLTSGWSYDESVKPWGIVMKPDGTYQEFTALYREFINWKEKYPSPPYDYDPNISFEEWKREYTLPVLQPFGVPSGSEYYDSEMGYESPKPVIKEGVSLFPVDEYDWWNVSPYDSLFPFSEW